MTGSSGAVDEVHVTYDPDFKSKGKPPKGVLNWVARPAPGKEPPVAEARLYAEAVCPPHRMCCVLQQRSGSFTSTAGKGIEARLYAEAVCPPRCMWYVFQRCALLVACAV